MKPLLVVLACAAPSLLFGVVSEKSVSPVSDSPGNSLPAFSPSSHPVSTPPPPAPPPPSSSSSYSGPGSSSSSGSGSGYSGDPSSSRYHHGGNNNPGSGQGTYPRHGRGGSGRYYGGYSGYYWPDSFYWGGYWNYWGGYRYSPWMDRFYYDPYFYTPGSYWGYNDSAEDDGKPVFFPPTPPPLGAPLPPVPPNTPRMTAPAELAEFIGEPFYAPLSTRLFLKNLSDWQRKEIDDYKAAKERLVTELIRAIEANQKSDPETRRRTLEALAAEQTPKFAELEQKAEEFRTDLLRSGLIGFFVGTGNWNDNRQWRLGVGGLAKNRENTLFSEYQVVRAAIYYQEGLSPAQRRLLREIASELQVASLKSSKLSATEEDKATRFFSPSPARVRFNGDLSPEIATKLLAFDETKKAMKKELRDALYNEDSKSKAHRLAALKQLAAKQAPEFAVLEALAEDIRSALVRSNYQAKPTPTSIIPEPLAGMIRTYRADRDKLHQELKQHLQQISAVSSVAFKQTGPTDLNHKKLEINYDGDSDATKTNITKNLASFNKDNEARFNNLSKQEDAIRAELKKLLGSRIDQRFVKPVETLINEFTQSEGDQARWGKYREYEWAVFLPGMSPEQRRALLDKAVASLGIPLPGGELTP